MFYLPFLEATQKNFFKIKNEIGQTIFIKKTSLCWLLANNVERISNDRLTRFHATRGGIQAQPYLEADEKRAEIYIGDWCIFKIEENLIGQKIGFIYLNKKTKKQKEYTLKTAPVTPPENAEVTRFNHFLPF